MLNINNLTVEFEEGKIGSKRVVNGVSIKIKESEVVALLGGIGMRQKYDCPLCVKTKLISRGG